MAEPRRNRSRYAPADQAERAIALALKHGVKLKLGADGSVEILGRLDAPPVGGLLSPREALTPDEALAAWEAEHGNSRHA